MVDYSEKAYTTLQKMQGDNLDVVMCNMLTYATSSVFAPIIRDLNKPMVLVNMTGSATVFPHEDHFGAIVQAWYPGQMGGEAAASILFGDFAPSGKLPVTFYDDSEKLPDFTDYSMKNRTYRYTQDNILYPFGFGLTYGTTLVRDLSYENGIASVTVENPGEERVDDVVARRC